jgi:hypothetical protein
MGSAPPPPPCVIGFVDKSSLGGIPSLISLPSRPSVDAPVQRGYLIPSGEFSPSPLSSPDPPIPKSSFTLPLAPPLPLWWMHELGVAFVRPDTRGFTWLPNRLLPSQAARAHSDKLLARFREICKALEFSSMGLLPTPEPAQTGYAPVPEEGQAGEEGGMGGCGGGDGSGGGGGGGFKGTGGAGAPSPESTAGASGARGGAGGQGEESRLSTRTLSSSSSEEERVTAPVDYVEGEE